MISIATKFLSVEQALKKAQMSAIIRERWTQYDNIEAVRMLPPLEYFGKNEVWLGSFSRTSTQMKEKFIVQGVGISPDDDAPPLATPSEIARTWVTASLDFKLKAHHTQLHFWNSYNHHAPYFARAGIYPDMVYIDLKSAYWSIMQVVGWGAEYHDCAIVRRLPVNDFPFGHVKLARNSLATVCLPTPSSVWKDGALIQRKSKGIVNQGLYFLITDILQAIALDMREFNPVYINTDGYIIPARFEDVARRKIDEEWGLLLEKKHSGNAVVYGVGSYTIGNHKTKRIGTFQSNGVGINPRVPSDMLRRYFRFLADRFPPAY